jgi:hypothetical protein
MPLADEELVARAQRGDSWAIEEFVCRYQQKAYAIAYHPQGDVRAGRIWGIGTT